MRTAFATAACIGLSATLSLAQNAAGTKQAPPKPGPSQPFRLQQRTHYVLPNGLQVNLLHYGTVPKVEIDVHVGAGSVDLDSQHVGFSALTASLMAEGTQKHSGADLARAAAAMGGALSASGGTYDSTFTLDVLSDRAPAAVSLLGEVIEQPAFPEKDFTRLQNDALRDIAVSLANPGFLANQKYVELMFGDQPYGRVLPTEAMVKGYTLADVHKYYDVNFGAARTSIYVVGQFDDAAVRSALSATFGGWRKGAAPLKPMQKPASEGQFALVPQPGAAQSNVMYGIAVPDMASPDEIPLQVTDSLLGGSFASRITSNIREAKGYTYSPYSFIDNGYKVATWQEGAAITTASTGPALTEIDNEIKRLQTTPPSAEELSAIQRYSDGVFVLRNSTRGGIAAELSNIDFHELTDDYLVNYTRRIDAVTPVQVQQIATKYLIPARMTLVVVGDPAIVGPQLGKWQH